MRPSNSTRKRSPLFLNTDPCSVRYKNATLPPLVFRGSLSPATASLNSAPSNPGFRRGRRNGFSRLAGMGRATLTTRPVAVRPFHGTIASSFALQHFRKG